MLMSAAPAVPRVLVRSGPERKLDSLAVRKRGDGVFIAAESGCSPGYLSDPFAWRRCLQSRACKRAGTPVRPQRHPGDRIGAGPSQTGAVGSPSDHGGISRARHGDPSSKSKAYRNAAREARAPHCGPQQFKVQLAIRPAYDVLPIEGDRLHPECRQCLDDARHAVCPVVATAEEHVHAVAIAPTDEPEAVVLDLIGPVRVGWHVAGNGRQVGFDRAGRMATGPIVCQRMIQDLCPPVCHQP